MSERYDLGDDVPLPGDAGWLLAAAIAAGRPTSLADLGRTVGLTRLQASRAGKRMRATRLLLESREGYETNRQHPMFDELARLLYLLTGAHPHETHDEHFGRQSRDDYDLMMAGLDKRLPPALRSSEQLGGEPTIGALVARQTAVLLDQYAVHLGQIHALAQDAYSTTGDERLRDYIHLFLQVGEGARIAARTLRAGARRQSWGASPYEPVVTDTEWERARVLLELECNGLDDRAARLEQAHRVGEQAAGLRQEIVDVVHRLRDDDELMIEALPGVREQAQTLSALKDRAIAQNLIWHGGTPSMHQVGHAGEALLIAWLSVAAVDGRAIAETMRRVS